MAAATSASQEAALRRAQIIDATIETLAELGFARTTFVRIVARGGLSSTRLISYHFDGKDSLMRAVVADVYRSIDEFLLDRAGVDPASRPIRQPPGHRSPAPVDSAAAQLRAYISGTIAYVERHRSRMRALQSIFAAWYDDPESPAVAQADPRGAVLGHLQDVLHRGQARGEFRSFDPLVVASMVQCALEGVPHLLDHRPDLDLRRYGDELVLSVDLATRNHRP
jgi:AcrR family transcriptional regulator